MGKGTTTTTPVIPNELSGLYRNTANMMKQGQRMYPLLGSGMVPPVEYTGPYKDPDENNYIDNKKGL